MNPSYTELAWDVGLLGLLVFVWSFHRNHSVWCWELLSAAVNTFYGYGLSSRALGMLQGTGLEPILQIIRDIFLLEKGFVIIHIIFCQLPDGVWVDLEWAIL